MNTSSSTTRTRPFEKDEIEAAALSVRQRFLALAIRDSQAFDESEDLALFARKLEAALQDNAESLGNGFSRPMRLRLLDYPARNLFKWTRSLMQTFENSRQERQIWFRFAYELKQICESYKYLERCNSERFPRELCVQHRKALEPFINTTSTNLRNWIVSNLTHGVTLERMVFKSEKRWGTEWTRAFSPFTRKTLPTGEHIGQAAKNFFERHPSLIRGFFPSFARV